MSLTRYTSRSLIDGNSHRIKEIVMKDVKNLSMKAIYVLLTIGAMIVASGAPMGPGGGSGG